MPYPVRNASHELTVKAIRRSCERARRVRTGLFLAFLLLGTGCAANPVTGQRELSLLSTADEISIGESEYGPLQQMGGGQYQVDPGVAEYVASVGQRVAAFSDRDLPSFLLVNLEFQSRRDGLML